MLLRQHDRTSALAISLHANQIVLRFYASQETFSRDSNTSDRLILRGKALWSANRCFVFILALCLLV